jgi:hypothetical protein
MNASIFTALEYDCSAAEKSLHMNEEVQTEPFERRVKQIHFTVVCQILRTVKEFFAVPYTRG